MLLVLMLALALILLPKETSLVMLTRMTTLTTQGSHISKGPTERGSKQCQPAQSRKQQVVRGNTTITTTTTAITEHPKPHPLNQVTWNQEACTAMTTMFKTMRMPVSARKDRHYFSCLRPLQQSGPADDCRRPVPKALASRLGSCVKWHIDVSNHEDLTWDRSSPEMQLWFLGTRAERRVMPRRLPTPQAPWTRACFAKVSHA